MSMAGMTNWKDRRSRSDFLLNAVGLHHRRTHRLTQLSGGEQQRVAISVALANNPVLLLGDEPTGEVDSTTAQSIMDTFRNLSQEMNLTTIIVTHDPRIASQVDRVVAIRDGKISTETVRRVSQLEQAMTGRNSESDDTVPEQQEVTFHEFVVLDSAGRLQIPKEIREKFGIDKRAEMEVNEEGIMIRPTESSKELERKTLSLEEQIAFLFEADVIPIQKPRRQRWLRLFKRKQ
jgi:putative ABC transport system ATP-binding protein